MYPIIFLLSGLQNFTLNSSDAETLNKYYVAQYKVDLYHLFIHKGIELATKKGVITYIMPNTFLKNKHNDKLRQYILDNTTITNFVLFYKQVFENAAVDNTIFSFVKEKGLKIILIL